MAAGRQTEGGLSTMLVGIANPETIEALMDLARCLAGYADYNVIATHILVVPPQAHLGSARGSAEMAKARQLLLDAIREGAGEEVPVKGVVEVAREVSEGLVSAAETQEVSLILVGHSERAEEDEAAGKRFDRVMHQVARETKADLVVAKFRRDQIGSILLPINTGLNLAVSGMLAAALSRAKSAPVTLIHLLREDETEEQARERLEALLADHEMGDLGELVVEQPPEGVDPLDRMLEIANRHDVAIVGAEPRPSVAESIFGSWAERIASQADCTVLLVRAKSTAED